MTGRNIKANERQLCQKHNKVIMSISRNWNIYD